MSYSNNGAEGQALRALWVRLLGLWSVVRASVWLVGTSTRPLEPSYTRKVSFNKVWTLELPPRAEAPKPKPYE